MKKLFIYENSVEIVFSLKYSRLITTFKTRQEME